MKKLLKDLLNIPNTLSLIRLFAAPMLAFIWFELERPITALIFGVVTGITDLFDGILARKLNQITDIGALIDQLGDLIFEAVCLFIGVLLTEFGMWILVVYLFREFTVSVIRTYVISHGGSLPSSWIGKAKSSLLQYGFFPFYLGVILLDPQHIDPAWTMVGISPGRMLIIIGKFSIFSGMFVSIYAAAQYIKAFAEFYAKQAK